MSRISDQSAIQLKQRVLHFRSEILQQERLLKQLEKKLRERDKTIMELSERIEELTEHAVITRTEEEEVRENEKDKPMSEATLLIRSFLTYSVMVPVTDDEEPYVIKGNFVVRNEGNIPLIEPVICLSFSDAQDANLSGRIERPSSNKKDDYVVTREGMMEAWSYVEENAEKVAKETGQFWLRPPVETLLPGEELIFSDFEVTIQHKQETPHTVKIYGFVYSAELPAGQQAENVVTLALI